MRICSGDNMSNIKQQNVGDVVRENYMPYATETVVNRALPSVFDGLKPAHRYVLYTAYKMGILRGKKTKSANLVGQTMRYNPHGDQTIYETAVRLTDSNEALLLPLFIGKGNFGKTYSRDMAFAAARYTEIGLADIASEFFALIDKGTVDMVDNYDGTLKEPVLLPVTFPNILVNPNLGIAVGMAGNICSFNLKEVCEATIAVLNGEEDLTRYIKAPDFSTGGEYLYDEKELFKVITSGRGSFKIRSKWRFDEQDNCIEIYEIPYTTTVEAILDKITELIKESKIKEISDVRDETDLSGLKLTIDLKRGADPQKLMQKLYKLTALEDSFSCNFNVLYEDKEHGYKTAKVMGVREILEHWTDWRIECLIREYTNEHDKLWKDHHVLEGLEQVLLDIDKAIEIIRGAEDDDDAIIQDLMNYFKITEAQATHVANIRLKQLNQKHILSKIQEKNGLEERMKYLKDTVDSREALSQIIIEQLQGIVKKYGADRRTTISLEKPVDYKDVIIDDYSCTYVISKQGYLKKNIRYSEQQNLKEGDAMLMNVAANNKADIIIITDKANAYSIKGHTIDECKPSERGTFLPPLVGMEADETILYMVVTESYEGHILYGYENGKLAKIPLKQFKSRYTKLVKVFNQDSPIVKIMQLETDVDIVLTSSIDKVLLFNTDLVPAKSTKNCTGVGGIKSKNGSRMTGMYLASSVFGELSEEEYEWYRANRDAIGKYIKKEHDWTQEQLTL